MKQHSTNSRFSSANRFVSKLALHRLSLTVGIFISCSAVEPHIAQAQETLGWSFYDGGSFGKSGSATNGPISDSSLETGGNPVTTTIGNVNSDVFRSELYLYRYGYPATYGENVSFGSRIAFNVYNKPGQTGPITVTISPYTAILDWAASAGQQSGVGNYVSLTVTKNSNPWLTRKSNTDYYVYPDGSVHPLPDPSNDLSASTVSFQDGDQLVINFSHQVGGVANFYSVHFIRATALYTTAVSANGFLSLSSRADTNQLAILPPIQPNLSSSSFTDASHTQVSVSGNGGITNLPLAYYVKTSTNLSLWTPFQTNTFSTNGNFSFTFPVNTNEPQRFFRVDMTP